MKNFVVKTDDLEEVREFFETLGLVFDAEQHGDGPYHYACEKNGVVFEIYPK